MKKTYIWLPLIIGVSIAVGIFIGNVFVNRTASIGSWRQGNNKLSVVFDFINKSYVDTVDTNALVEEAIPAILSGLDPHSAYISAEDMSLRGDELDGHFSGIGVEFIIQNDTISIVNVIYGGPSEAAGIMPGDRVVSVNDTVFVGKEITNEKAFRHLRGKKDSKVKLGIKRSSSEELLDFTITRAEVPVKSVDASYMLKDGIGYIKISQFGATTYNEFISAMAKLKSLGSNKFVIDLQQNTGGYLGAAVMMINEFLPKDELIVYTEGRTSPREDIFAQGTGTFKEDQIVVLIDEGSASASEIFAGAIQDNDRGLVVGRRSFGKGLVQTPHVFKDGSSMRLTIARYHTPSGRCIQKAYEKGKGDEYGKDIINRYMRGEFDSRDSIKFDNLPLFKTKGGRPVYGNDGILSDIFVPRDTIGLNSYYLKVANMGLIRDFAFDYVDKNRISLAKNKDWKSAAKYLELQLLVDSFVEYAEQKGIRRRPYLIEESRLLIQTQLEALIVRDSFGSDGFYSIYQRNDKLIKMAVNLLEKNKATPKAVANEEYK